MNAITIRKKLESETIHLPELKPLIGKTVEIIVREAPLVVPASDDWNAAMQAARELEDYDFEAWRQQREYDRSHAGDHLP